MRSFLKAPRESALLIRVGKLTIPIAVSAAYALWVHFADLNVGGRLTCLLTVYIFPPFGKESVIPVGLALGAGFGANATAIASSANIISLSLAEKNGYRITFAEFLKIGMLVLMATLLLAQLTIWVRIMWGYW